MRKRITERRIKSKDYNICFRIAIYYSITHSDYFLDRALALLGRSRKVAKVVSCYISKLSDKLWFVYRQTCLQVLWLTSRSKWISDKLNVREISRETLVKAKDSPEYKKSDRTPFEICTKFFERCNQFRRVPYKVSPMLQNHKRDDVRARRSTIGTLMNVRDFELFDISDDEW
jgi:hypothetical protein